MIFQITKNDFRRRNLVVASLVMTWLIIAFIQIKFEIFNPVLVGVVILFLIIAIGLSVNLIKTYKDIGQLKITNTEIQIHIGGKTSIIKIEKGEYDYIKFYYKAFKGDQPASALIGFGTLFFYNGAGNTFEISSGGNIYNFDVKISNYQELKLLKQRLIQINSIGQNVFAMKK